MMTVPSVFGGSVTLRATEACMASRVYSHATLSSPREVQKVPAADGRSVWFTTTGAIRGCECATDPALLGCDRPLPDTAHEMVVV
jgi:hypothetical protein